MVPDIPVPGIDPTRLAELFQSQQGGILGVFNLLVVRFLGSPFTIFALGIMPYILLPIIMQLSTIAVLSLEALKKRVRRLGERLPNTPGTGRRGWLCFKALVFLLLLNSGKVALYWAMFCFVTVMTLLTVYVLDAVRRATMDLNAVWEMAFLLSFLQELPPAFNALGGLFELVRTGSMHPKHLLYLSAF